MTAEFTIAFKTDPESLELMRSDPTFGSRLAGLIARGEMVPVTAIEDGRQYVEIGKAVDG